MKNMEKNIKNMIINKKNLFNNLKISLKVITKRVNNILRKVEDKDIK